MVSEVMLPQLLNAESPMVLILEGIVIAVKAHSAKASSPMAVTLEGICKKSLSSKAVHPLKPFTVVKSSFSGHVTLASEVQFAKASLPMEVRESGKTISVRSVPANAYSPIVVRPVGSVIEERLVPANKLVVISVTFVDERSTEENAHPEKAPIPKEVSVLGNATEVKLEQPLNALFPMVVRTEPERLMEVSDVQFLKAPSPMVSRTDGTLTVVSMLQFKNASTSIVVTALPERSTI